MVIGAYLCFLISTELRKDHSDRLPLCIADGTEPVAGHSTCKKTGKVGNDKTKARTAEGTNPTPPRCDALNLGSQ